MDVNPDYADLLRALYSAGARYLVVGAYAVVHHSRPRYTKDLDVWVEPTPANVARVWRALAEFGAPLAHVRPEDFANPRLVFQMGVEPNRVDITMGIDAVEFASAWRNRVRTTYGGVPMYVLGKRDLLRNKRALGRPQDLLDIQALSARPRGAVRGKRR